MNQNSKTKSSRPQVVVVAPQNQTSQQTKPRRRGGRGRGGRGQAQQNGNVKITEVGRSLRTVGSAVGGLLGQPALGRAAGGFVSRIFGQGDYVTNSVSQNSLVSKSGPPAFGDFTAGFRVRHREYITDISSSVAFTSKTYALNPGVSSTFPWLSTVAANFEEYRFHGAVVYLNTTSGASVSSTNTALGLWGVVTQYDPAEPEFSTKQQAENYVGCQSAVPSQSLLHGIECKPRANIFDKMYVRSGALDSTQDLKFFDWGKTQVFTSGSQSSNVIGELWISYDVEFYKPRLPTGGYVAYTDRYYLLSLGTDAKPLGNVTALPYNGSNLGSSVDGANNRVVLPASAPPGLYMATWKVDLPSVSAVTSIALNATGSCTNLSLFNGNSQTTGYAPQMNTTQRYYMIALTFQKIGTSNAGYVGFSIAGSSANFSSDIVLTLMNAAFIPQITAPTAVKLEQSEVSLIKELLTGISIDDLKHLLRKKPKHELGMEVEDVPETKAPHKEKELSFEHLDKADA